MNIIDTRTIMGIAAEVAEGKRTLKSIANECRHFEKQTNCYEAKAAYTRLSWCKTRAQFNAVIKSL